MKKIDLVKILFLIGALSSLVITGLNYQNFKYQTPIMIELQSAKMEFLNTNKLDPEKFLFPETTVTSLPINAIISDYYFKEGMDSIGLKLLWSSKKFNPFVSFNDYMLSKYYYILLYKRKSGQP